MLKEILQTNMFIGRVSESNREREREKEQLSVVWLCYCCHHCRSFVEILFLRHGWVFFLSGVWGPGSIICWSINYRLKNSKPVLLYNKQTRFSQPLALQLSGRLCRLMKIIFTMVCPYACLLASARQRPGVVQEKLQHGIPRSNKNNENKAAWFQDQDSAQQHRNYSGDSSLTKINQNQGISYNYQDILSHSNVYYISTILCFTIISF